MSSKQTLEEDERIIHIPPIQGNLDPGGIGYTFYNKMLQHQENIAQIDPITGEKDTYRSLLQRCIRTAIKMRSDGITSDDIVSVCSHNHLNVCVPFISTFFLNAKFAALDPTLSLNEISHLVTQVKPKLIFVDKSSVELIEKIGTKIVVFGETNKHVGFSDYLTPNPEEDHFEPYKAVNLKETALVFFSSGTSGLPKGICISHYAFLNQLSNCLSFGYCYDVILAFSTLYWGTTSKWLSIAIFKGTTRIISPNFDLSRFWDVISKYKPTFAFLTPVQFIAINNSEKPKHLETSCLKDIVIGGAPIHEKQILRGRRVFPTSRVQKGFGQTEATGFVFGFKPNKTEELALLEIKPGSVGTGIPGFSYKIVDILTNEVLGKNQQGELRFKTEFQLNGYYQLDSSDVWDSDGWLKTGDIAYYDDDRCFYIVDRIKEMLKFQSYHVSPTYLEGILSTHPAVKSSIVIGLPHDVDGDHPMAIVVLRENYKTVTPLEIEKFLEEKVNDRQKLRGGVKIIENIPFTPSGKVKRKFIKDMVLQGKI